MTSPDSTPTSVPSQPDQPQFVAISRTNVKFRQAYDKAAETIPQFIEYIRRGVDGYISAKLRFRAPDESDRLGEDRFVFLWLTTVQFHADKKVFSGTFFEVPIEFQKWHQVGQKLVFKKEDIFDWMVLTRDGHLFGGYTLRAARNILPEGERADYDRYIGVQVYEPEDSQTAQG